MDNLHPAAPAWASLGKPRLHPMHIVIPPVNSRIQSLDLFLGYIRATGGGRKAGASRDPCLDHQPQDITSANRVALPSPKLYPGRAQFH
jgi:hypothetical protein